MIFWKLVRMELVIITLALLFGSHVVCAPDSGEVVYEWTVVDFDWPADKTKERFIANGEYNATHNLISGIKAYKDEIYLTVPRLRYTEGVPSTLNKLVKRGNKTVLSPYPDWASQELRNCKALQCAMSMEVDPLTGYMYVIDPGRSGLFGKKEVQTEPHLCPPKVVVYDLNTGRLVRSHDFPPDVVNKETNFLNDIVIDRGLNGSTEVTHVYITDAVDSKLIVLDLTTNQSWAIHDKSMDADPGAGSNITVNGVTYRLQTPIDGMAMSPDFQFVYFCALGSKDLYQVSTSVLRTRHGDFGSSVRLVGPKISQTGGMTYATNNLYYGALTKNAVYRWNVAADIESQNTTAAHVTLATETEIVRDDERLQWPDSFTVDENGYLWFTACRAHLFLLGGMDFNGAHGANFRIWKVKISEKSYLASKSDSTCIEKTVLLSVVLAAIVSIWT